MSSEHVLGNRMLEVKVATPKVAIKYVLNLKPALVHGCFTLCYDFTADSCNVFILKEEMRAPAKKVTRIFVARIPQSVTEATFRRYMNM